MRIKLDENIPASLAEWLRNVGHDADTVPQEGLSGQSDQAVWDAAQHEQRFFVTQDLDFSDTRRFIPGSHAGLLIVRLADPGRRSLIERIQRVFESEAVDAWKGCVVTVTERKIRVRKKV